MRTNRKQKMDKKIKGITLSRDIIRYIENLSKIENRNFSNMVEVIIKRYKIISEQLDQGSRLDRILN